MIFKYADTKCIQKFNDTKYSLNTYHAMGKFSRRQTDDILKFPKKTGSDTTVSVLNPIF